MKAITVKYLSYTNTKPIRLKATDNDGNSITIARSGQCEITDAVKTAALALCEKMQWPKDIIGGQQNNDTWVFVFTKQ